MHNIFSWIINNYIEVFGVLTGFIYIYLSVKQNVWNWFFGILNVGSYIFVFFVSKLYADMSLQIIYLAMSFYGWFHWLYGKKNDNEKQIPVINIKLKLSIQLFLFTLVGMCVIIYILKNYTSSDVPYADAFITAFSITATWMLAQKIIEHWLVWIVIDSFSIGVYIYKGLYPTVLLYLVFTILAVVGYIEWKKELKIKN